jgi:hypothetical protein
MHLLPQPLRQRYLILINEVFSAGCCSGLTA